MATQTILKALMGKINYPLSEDSYITALIDAGLDGDAAYTKALKKDVDLCAAELILVVCTSADVKEGGYSLTLNERNALLKVRSLIAAKYPDDVIDYDKPKVSAVKGKW